MLLSAEPSQKPSPVSSLNDEITGKLKAVIRKCMEENPDDRYQTDAELIAALENCRENPPENRQ